MENKINSVDDKLQEIDQNTEMSKLQSLQNEKNKRFGEGETALSTSVRSTTDPRENFKSAHFSPLTTSSLSCSDVANRVLKRARNDATADDGEGSDKGSVGDRETAPKKKSRAKKMQGLTYEQAELRRSRTNEQERERQRNLSEAMEALKKCDMPFNPHLNNKEDSKIYLLKTATAYIYALSRMIDDHDRGLVHHCEHSLMLGTYGTMHNGAHPLGASGCFEGYDAQASQRLKEDSSNMARNYTSAMTNERLEAGVDRRILTTLDEHSFIYRSHEHVVQNRPISRQYPYARNYTEKDVQASQSSLVYPSFMHRIVGNGTEVQHTRSLQCSPSASPCRHLDESMSCLTPQGGNTGLVFNSVVMGNIEDPSYHSTPMQRGCTLTPDIKGSLLRLGNTPATSLGQLPLQQTPTLGKEVSIPNDTSANSSGYLSMLSAPEDNSSKIFSPERLHQTIDDMYSESFLAPTSSLPF